MGISEAMYSRMAFENPSLFEVRQPTVIRGQVRFDITPAGGERGTFSNPELIGHAPELLFLSSCTNEQKMDIEMIRVQLLRQYAGKAGGPLRADSSRQFRQSVYCEGAAHLSLLAPLEFWSEPAQIDAVVEYVNPVSADQLVSTYGLLRCF